MLKVVSITETIVDYNGYQFMLGSVASEKIPEYTAVFAKNLNLKEGDYIYDVSMDLTTAPIDGSYVDCLRIRDAKVSTKGTLDEFISLKVFGIIFKPRKTSEECPKVGMDARPYLRFTLKSRDAFDHCISRPAYARKAAPAVFALENRTFVEADVTIRPDKIHKFVLYVRAFQEVGGN